MMRAFKQMNMCFYSPEIDPPYITEEEKERLLGLYQYLHSRAHNSSHPLSNIYYTGSNENLLAWVRVLHCCYQATLDEFVVQAKPEIGAARARVKNLWPSKCFYFQFPLTLPIMTRIKYYER